MHNRIFIHDDVDRADVFNQGMAATHNFNRDKDARKFSDSFQAMMEDIKKAAKMDIRNI